MNNTTACALGSFLYNDVFCAPCPPHTVGLDGLACTRCPADEFARGLGNTQCTPCLYSNMTLDPIACPVLVPAYYYTAASGVGIAVLLFVLLVAAICVVQYRSGQIQRLRIKHDAMTMLRRLTGTNNEEAAEQVGYEVMNGTMMTENEDTVDPAETQPRMVHTETATYSIDDDGDVTSLPDESVVDFEKTAALDNAVITVHPPPPPQLQPSALCENKKA